MSLHHSCNLAKKHDEAELFSTNRYHSSRLRTGFLVSSNNPVAKGYFRSNQTLHAEKKRQIDLHKVWLIHPLSKFRVWYDIYLIFLYTANLVGKPIDCAFARRKEELYVGYRYVSFILDMLCWIDILVNFNTGYAVKKESKIELRQDLIAKHYLHSPYFICDLLSSIPRNLPYLIATEPNKYLLGVISILGLLKFARIFTVVKLINKTSRFFQVKSTGLRFLFTSILVTLILIHWNACMQFLIPRLTGRYFNPDSKAFLESWIYTSGIYYKPFVTRYRHCFFKGSAEMLGLQLKFYRMNTISDYIVSTCTYWIGKIIVTSIWIILTVAILNARSMELKYLEVINQLDEYMKQKQLPLNLREKLSKYYDFKYHRVFFKENMITNLLCPNLRKEVNIHVCQSMIASVNLFADFTPEQISRLVSKLISEIFLPKDIIFRAGMHCDSMYFLSSGTVAVYSHSGKEICHLQEGAYFGEVSLVFKNQLTITTIIAIEYTKVYRLKIKSFEECLKNDKTVLTKLITQAEKWMKIVTSIEDEYKKKMFEQTYATTDQNNTDIRKGFGSSATMLHE